MRMGSSTAKPLVPLTWTKTGDVCNSCERGLTRTLGYSECWRHVEERGTSKVSYNRRAGGRWDGFLILLSSHGGRGSMT